LGGGSLYFKSCLGDLVLGEDLGGSEIVLYDIDGEKVELMAGVGRRLAQEAGTGYRVRSTVDLADAVDGADFAISSIGGSGAEVSRNVYGSYYHNCDVQIPLKYGIRQVIGDTGGPAGMMMGLRSVPVYIDICREMEKRCPNVILFSHSNPMAVLCRAMNKYTDIKVYGVCHGVQNGIGHAATVLGLERSELECRWVGTNHFYWLTSILHKGKDVYPQLMRGLAEGPLEDKKKMCARLSQVYGYNILYQTDSHAWEFCPYAASVDELPYALDAEAERFGNSPGLVVKPPSEATAEDREAFFSKYREILDEAKLPPAERKSSMLGENTGAVISAIAHGRREVAILNVPNRGAISNLPYTALVELETITDSQGVRAIQSDDAPPVLKGILEKRFAWHELVVDAAVKGDKSLALQALMIDEMSILPDKAEAMLTELLAASKDLLPQFNL
ncbi:MAG: hypothetical protein J7M14_03225, partial [Planctomycetes bacterium]|nr:hypothetical protein [Planctomycetota bacterium]